MPTAERNSAKLLRRCAASSAVAVAAVLLPVSMAGASPTAGAVPSLRAAPTTTSTAAPGQAKGTPQFPPHRASEQATSAAGAYAPVTPVTTTVPASEGYVGGSSVSVGGMWSGGDLEATTNLEIPITFGGLLLAFVLVQWLIDHRDPRFVEAPARKEDDSLGFE